MMKQIYKTITAILLFFICLSNVSFSQFSAKGSFIIAAVCKKGIIMGSDSRLTLSNNKVPIGYVDSIQKIFPGKNYVIGLMGTANVGNYNVSYLTKRFTDSLRRVPEDKPFVFEYWHEYIKKMLPDAKINLDGMAIFIIRYQKSKPKLYYNYLNGSNVIAGGNRFIEPDTTTFGSKYFPKMSYKKAKKWIKSAINQYAKDKNKTKIIGGPIYFVKISKKNRVKWFGKKPPREFETLQDFVKEPNKIIKYN